MTTVLDIKNKLTQSEFIDELDLEDMGDGEHFRVINPFRYYSAFLRRTVKVSAGFVTDLASVPRPFRWFLPKSGPYNKAAVVHDAAYNNALTDNSGYQLLLSKDAADSLFREAMLVCGVGEKKANIMYTAVHLFGRPEKVSTVA